MSIVLYHNLSENLVTMGILNILHRAFLYTYRDRTVPRLDIYIYIVRNYMCKKMIY